MKVAACFHPRALMAPELLLRSNSLLVPELRAMADLSRKADRRYAQLGLADFSESRTDFNCEDSDMQDRVQKMDKLSNAGKSLESAKEAKITSTVLSRSHGRIVASVSLKAAGT